jgi:hypothetical protein
MNKFWQDKTATMKKEVLGITLMLIVFNSCTQTEQNEIDPLLDSVATELRGTENENIDSNEPELILTPLGIGLVAINFDDKTTLFFYTTPNDNEPKKTLQFFNDLSIHSWNIRDLEEHEDWLNPEIMRIDYSQFVFRCLTAKDSWLEVMVNNETGETLWLKKNELTGFKDWETYFREMFGVARLQDHPQKIKSSSNENSAEINYQGQDCFQVKSMDGDWIEIFTADYCDESYTNSKTKIQSGWIKWRQGNKLLIEYYTTS